MQHALPEVPQAIPSARLFFSLWPDDNTRQQLAHWRDALHAKSGGRRIQSEDLHLTLAFLGDVPLKTIELAIDAAQSVSPRRFDFNIDKPDYWPHNHIVWAGGHIIPQELKQLVSQLRKALTLAGIAFHDQQFTPHITLIRDAPSDFYMVDLPVIIWAVDRFVLVSSTSGQQPRYRVLREWIANSP